MAARESSLQQHVPLQVMVLSSWSAPAIHTVLNERGLLWAGLVAISLTSFLAIEV